MVREILPSSGRRDGREQQEVKMSRSHKPKLYERRRNNPACCRQVVSSLYPGASPAPADSQPRPAVPLAVPSQDSTCRCSGQTKLEPGHLRCAGSCAPLKGQDQHSGCLLRLVRNLMHDPKRIIFPLCLVSKVGASLMMMGNRMM